MALVVGNGAYLNRPALPKAVNDAKAMGEALERLGFDVQVALNVTHEKILMEFDSFVASANDAEAAVFYYSGHAIQIGGNDYLMPVDINPTSERVVRYGSMMLPAFRCSRSSINFQSALVAITASNSIRSSICLLPRSRVSGSFGL